MPRPLWTSPRPVRQRAGVGRFRRDRRAALWDAGFLFGDRAAGGPEHHVLCEVNVSSVSPFPPEAMARLVAATLERLRPGLHRQAAPMPR